MLSQFEKQLGMMGDEVAKNVTRLFKQGIFDTNEIRGVMEQAGFYDLETAWVDSYADVIKLNQDVAQEIGHNFMLSEKMVNSYDLITEANVERLHIQNEVYIADMKQRGVNYLLEGKTFTDTAFKTEITDALNGMKRRLAAEAYTGIYQADSAIKKDFFEQAGIEKYYYDGPNDNVTRDECLATLTDGRQQTGWTMADIQSSQTPFIERGGYNCRHEWLPLVEGLSEPSAVGLSEIPELDGFDPSILKLLSKTEFDNNDFPTIVVSEFQKIAESFGLKHKAAYTDKEIKSIGHYKASGYNDINNYARSSYYKKYHGNVNEIKKEFSGSLRKKVLKWDEDYTNMLSAYNKSVLDKNVTLYRGMQGVPADIAKYKGRIIEGGDFWSTSFDPDMAKSFMSVDEKGALLKINVKKGHKAIFPEGFGLGNPEAEVLFSSAKFKVSKVINKGFYWLLEGDLL